MTQIYSKEWNEGWWHVHCAVTLPDGTRTGIHSVELPETATDSEIEEAILGLYGLSK